MTQSAPRLATPVLVENQAVMRRTDWHSFALLTVLQFALIFAAAGYWFTRLVQSPGSANVWLGAAVTLVVVLACQWRWGLLTQMQRPKAPPASAGLRVAVVTTIVPSRESLEMLEHTLQALVDLRYPHDTWVLDEEDNPIVRQLCQQLGARHYTRCNKQQWQSERGRFQSRSKHGNYNAFLHEIGFESYDIVSAFDPDHVPRPDFLDQVLGCFRDPRVAWVQLPQAYYNQRASLVAHGAAQETRSYYAIDLVLSYSLGYTPLFGCHSTHRVSALKQVGGFADHDADDLLLARRYQCANWRGVYLPLVAARGMTPVDWASYLRQQQRWARSVLELRWWDYPQLEQARWSRRLMSWWHGINYLRSSLLALAGMTLLLTLLVINPTLSQRTAVDVAILLLVVAALKSCRVFEGRFRGLELEHEGLPWRAMLMQWAKWPWMVSALVQAALHRRRPYEMTPKAGAGRSSWRMLWPHLLAAALLGAAAAGGLARELRFNPLLHLPALALAAMSVGIVLHALAGAPAAFNPALLRRWIARFEEDAATRSPAAVEEPAAEPTKVLQVELSQPVEPIIAQGYSRARVLLRLHGDPLGWVDVPLMQGECDTGNFTRIVLEQQSDRLVRQILLHRLGHPFTPGSNWAEYTPAAAAVESWPRVTVAVCTRGRSQYLARCLDALVQLDYPELELLVVDNAPVDDAAAQLVARFPQARYGCEPRPGLDWARNRAIIEGTGQIIAYTDDDVIVDPAWVRNLVLAFNLSPEVMAVTGLVLPYQLETQSQQLFENYGGFGRGFERRWVRYNPQERWYGLPHGAGNLGTGANMAYRREVFEQLGGFDPAMDVGTPTNGGGDLEMFFRVLKHGHLMIYEPRAMVWHCHRRTRDALWTQLTNNGIALYSYFFRCAANYADERMRFLRFGLWWLGHWDIRRLVRGVLSPSMFPVELIASETIGAASGYRRFRQSVTQAQEIELIFGPAEPIQLQEPPPPREVSDQARPRRVGVLQVDLARGVPELEQAAEFDSVRLFVRSQQVVCGHVDFDNGRKGLTSQQVREAIAFRLGLKLLDPTGVLGAELREHVEKQLRALLRRQENPGGWPEATRNPLSTDVPVSIVVATCDRPGDLRQCLESLLAQQTRRLFEVIVVDNRPSSGVTIEVVRDYPTVRLVSEARSGVAYARNRGFLMARHPIVVSVDDDVAADPNWLEQLVAPLARPEVAMVSGNVLPIELETQAQQLFESYGGLSRGYNLYEFDERWFNQSRWRAAPTWVLGGTANLAFRAKLIRDRRVGLLEESLGPGMPSGVGEDTYFFYRTIKAGYHIVYQPGAVVWHHHRRDVESLHRQVFNYSKGHVSYHLMTLLVDRDARAALHLLLWLPHAHLWRIKQRLLRRTDYPLTMILLEIKGNLLGPWALWQSLQRVRDEALPPYQQDSPIAYSATP